MAAESELKISLTPQVSGLDDLIGHLRRTGEALLGLADSLQRLSDGSPDSARTTPDSLPGFHFPDEGKIGPAICPWVVQKRSHEVHEFAVDMDVSEIGASVDRYTCPGFPVRPWHPDNIKSS